MLTAEIEARLKMSSKEPQFIVKKILSMDILQCDDRRRNRLLVGQSVA